MDFGRAVDHIAVPAFGVIPLDAELIEVYKKNGVEVVEMSKADYDAWLQIAKETSYKNFAEKVPNGQKLIDEALAVE